MSTNSSKQQTSKDALAFIEKNKETYLEFLHKTFVGQFPYVCDYASDILISFIREKFGVGEIIIGYYHPTYEMPHMWAQIGWKTIDFTYFQFIIEKNWLKKENDQYKSHNNKRDLYEKWIESYQQSYLLNTSLCKDLMEEKRIQPSLCTYAKGKSFKEYLTKIKKLKNQQCLEKIIYENMSNQFQTLVS